MKSLAAAAREIAGLFIEDAGFALGILAWVALAAFVLRELPFGDPWRAAILLAGCLALLVENVLRAARKRPG
ncbi:MAG: hypothetical protein E6H72_09965 [Betaproteobacteria bacterium]|nr:MAG: hypothetical protein E6H72_09965 [Betaproteobacteria bacterium]